MAGFYGCLKTPEWWTQKALQLDCTECRVAERRPPVRAPLPTPSGRPPRREATVSQPRARGGELAVSGARTRGDALAACGRLAPTRARAGVRACARAWESGGGGAGAGRALPGFGQPGGGGAGWGRWTQRLPTCRLSAFRRRLHLAHLSPRERGQEMGERREGWKEREIRGSGENHLKFSELS